VPGSGDHYPESAQSREVAAVDLIDRAVNQARERAEAAGEIRTPDILPANGSRS
jgi:hypothetical protein